MRDHRGATAELDRLLYLVPRAMRPDGVSLGALADELGVTPRRLIKDIEILTARAYYLEPGAGSELQVFVEGDRLSIFSTGAFRRPVRLTAAEAFCVALGLRAAGLRDSTLRTRLERDLALPGVDEVDDGVFTSDAWSSPSDQLQATLHDAIRARRPVRFGYLKPGESVPEVRNVDPWGLLHAEGRWYLPARDHDADALRVFRLDRMTGAHLLEGSFTPEEWSVDQFVQGGRVSFRADGDELPPTARVRYGPAVARWARERWAGEDDDKGGWIVEHELLDPGWVVRHVLEYGADAELLSPRSLRRVLADTARRMARGGEPEAPTR